MNITGIPNQMSAIYEDISKNAHYEEDIVQIGIQEDIMKDRLMCGQIKILMNLLISDMNNIKDFNSITDERRNQIIDKVNFLKDVYNYDKKGKDYFFKLLLEQLYYVRSSLSSLDRKEKVALIIETIDPNFEQCKIYFDLYDIYKQGVNRELDTNDEEIIFDIIEKEFGKPKMKIINMEKLYVQRFGKNKDFSLK